MSTNGQLNLGCPFRIWIRRVSTQCRQLLTPSNNKIVGLKNRVSVTMVHDPNVETLRVMNDWRVAELPDLQSL